MFLLSDEDLALVITLEGWVDIMYYVMDAHSFYNFIYFILLIIVGSFFMINLCLVVIATQFSETKQRENQLMQEQRARYLSNDSTIASFSEPGSCYEELLKYICHIFRKVKRRTIRLYNNWQSKRRKKVNPNSTTNGQGHRGKKRITSIHHLIHHHHHHHHHHYHISNGSPRGPRSNPEICDLELKVMKPGGQLMLPSPSPNLQSPAPPPDSESVHSIYHADCHVEGPQVNCKSSNAPASIKLTAGLSNHGNMNYPTILPSPTSKASSVPVPKGKKNGNSPVAVANSPVNLGMDSYGKLQQLVGEHGLRRTPSRLSGLSTACPLPSPPGGTLTCELQDCPFCASLLEDPEFAFSESDSCDSDSNGVYEFTQDLRHGDHRDQLQQQRGRRKKKKKKPKERNKVTRLWKAFGSKLKRIVESKYFNRGIMIAILINTLSMGIEYHEQPDELTNALEISNIVFTSMFALEMLLKLLAFGLFGYIKNPYNIFDGIIVVISVWEIIGQSDGGLSVLRTFRLLRVLKLILTQEDWNVVLYNGMASTSSWAALYFVALMTFGNYVLFNLLVAILVEGFQAEGDANRSDTDEDKTSANFEDDFEKLKDLRATEMKMYSLAVTPNGHLEGRGSMPPPIIMRTAATPMPTPKCSPHMDSVHTFVDSRRGSNASLDPLSYDQKSLSSLRSSPCANWGTSSNWGSRRSSWNSLGRAPSLKKKNQSGERESLLSGEGKGSTDDDSDDAKSSTVSRPSLHRRAESLDCRSSLDLPELLQLPTMRHSLSISPMAILPAEYQDCNGKMVHVPSEFFLRVDGHKEDAMDYEDDMEDSYCYRIRKVLEPYKPQWCKSHEDWSLYLFSPQNRFRVMCQKVIAHKMFDHVVLVFIFLNCITIALERPDIDPHSTERIFLSVSNYIFTAIFVAEMMVKVVALGFFSGENTYLQSSWNVLDGVLVFVSIIDIIVSMASAGGAKILGVLRVLRLLRTLRPLRVISRAPGLKLVVETLISSLRPIGNIVLICCAFFIIFGILGVQLFKGKFYYCDGPDVKNITTKTDCTNARYKWVRRKYNFDNLGQALMSLFVLSSKDGWVNIMYDGLDAVGIDQQPIQNHNPWMLLYFISFLLIVSFFVLNMFVGVVVENFHKCRQHQEAEEARRREEKRLRRLEKKRRKAQRRPYYADYSPARKYIHTLCTSHYLDLFITFIIGVNVITMSMEHYNQPKDTLRECTREDKHCLSYLPVISPVYFVTFVLIAQFVLVNVVVAVLMKHLEESNKEAKEDAEMDAEIELEMSRGATASATSGSRGGAVAPESRPPYRNQETMKSESAVQGGTASLRPQDSQNLLTVRKISVSRMHSLPNDSYMFRPVMPAKAPFPLHEVEMETYPCKSQRVGVNQDLYQYKTAVMLAGEAIRTDSVEGQTPDRKDSLQAEPGETLPSAKQPQSTFTPSPLHSTAASLPGTPPRSPPSSPHRRPSTLTRKHTCGQHGVPSRPPSPGGSPPNPEGSLFESSDLADEEVRHINSSAKDWGGERSDTGSRSTSPFVSPAPSPVPLKNCSTTSLSRGSSKEKDLKKFYSIDTKGFLNKPSWADDQRRHSIEICPSISDGDCSFEDAAEEKQRSPAHIQTESEYIHGARRKKKMSPPCISIDPPMEDDGGAASRTKPSENSMLRRRTPSCEFPVWTAAP
ncbi:voltage-dependent t-type calcium channel subunit alpha-1h [Limosa lapponica baueri]|uniref:Voltage-dependent t-type calcium channel subunit alpha-1h n=1 Tax=Limosa lapponica baueri TaxID=1758121 RepID=A0A2I0TU02_LIMLA|nr:voltage-dependent t-type calcium channel subunit alpha-1h [Limosa lapponica baueri]